MPEWIRAPGQVSFVLSFLCRKIYAPGKELPEDAQGALIASGVQYKKSPSVLVPKQADDSQM